MKKYCLTETAKYELIKLKEFIQLFSKVMGTAGIIVATGLVLIGLIIDDIQALHWTVYYVGAMGGVISLSVGLLYLKDWLTQSVVEC